MAADEATPTGLRPAGDRPRLGQVLGRGLAVVVANAIALALLGWVLDDLSFENVWALLLAAFVIGVVNALIWPALAVVVVPLSVLTLGLGAIIVDALVVWLVLDELPGVTLDGGFWVAFVVTIGLTVVTTVVASLMAIDDDAWVDEQMARRARRKAQGAAATEVPGFVFLQIDGLSEQVLRRALSSGDLPTLHRWLHDGSHRLVEWETDWSSQTGVSQCGILHGSNDEMPAFRWLEKDSGTLMVSNHPKSAAEIERRHSDGNGLLSDNGSSYGNLFTGDATRAALTMSVAGKVKEGKVGAGYVRYFSRPDNAVRTMTDVVVDVVRERRAAADQRRRDVQPRVSRNVTYSLLRAFTTVVSRDVCVQGVLGDIADGRRTIYADLLGYDEVAHHSGPERADAIAVLRDIDHQIGRIQRSLQWAPRPYHLVVLSDHGQTQGPSFEGAYGETLEALVARLTGERPAIDPDSESGKTESTAWLRSARGDQGHDTTGAEVPDTDTDTDTGTDTDTDNGMVTVLGSGSLGLVYLPGPPRRLVREEIDERYPALIDGLRAHPGMGFVLVRSDADGAVVLGPRGQRFLDRPADGPDAVVGEDPLEPFGPAAVHQVSKVDGFRHVADLMLNSRYDADQDEVHAFEHQVSSHGGLGGPQTHPFILRPAELPDPLVPLRGAAEVYRYFKTWLTAP